MRSTFCIRAIRTQSIARPLCNSRASCFHSAMMFGTEKLEWLGYTHWWLNLKIRLFVFTWSRTWRTHIDTAWRHRPRLCITSRGKNHSRSSPTIRFDRVWHPIKCSIVICTYFASLLRYIQIWIKNSEFSIPHPCFWRPHWGGMILSEFRKDASCDKTRMMCLR